MENSSHISAHQAQQTYAEEISLKIIENLQNMIEKLQQVKKPVSLGGFLGNIYDLLLLMESERALKNRALSDYLAAQATIEVANETINAIKTFAQAQKNAERFKMDKEVYELLKPVEVAVRQISTSHEQRKAVEDDLKECISIFKIQITQLSSLIEDTYEISPKIKRQAIHGTAKRIADTVSQEEHANLVEEVETNVANLLEKDFTKGVEAIEALIKERSRQEQNYKAGFFGFFRNLFRPFNTAEQSATLTQARLALNHLQEAKNLGTSRDIYPAYLNVFAAIKRMSDTFADNEIIKNTCADITRQAEQGLGNLSRYHTELVLKKSLLSDYQSKHQTYLNLIKEEEQLNKVNAELEAEQQAQGKLLKEYESKQKNSSSMKTQANVFAKKIEELQQEIKDVYQQVETAKEELNELYTKNVQYNLKNIMEEKRLAEAKENSLSSYTDESFNSPHSSDTSYLTIEKENVDFIANNQNLSAIKDSRLISSNTNSAELKSAPAKFAEEKALMLPNSEKLASESIENIQKYNEFLQEVITNLENQLIPNKKQENTGLMQHIEATKQKINQLAADSKNYDQVANALSNNFNQLQQFENDLKNMKQKATSYEKELEEAERLLADMILQEKREIELAEKAKAAEDEMFSQAYDQALWQKTASKKDLQDKQFAQDTQTVYKEILENLNETKKVLNELEDSETSESPLEPQKNEKKHDEVEAQQLHDVALKLAMVKAEKTGFKEIKSDSTELKQQQLIKEQLEEKQKLAELKKQQKEEAAKLAKDMAKEFAESQKQQAELIEAAKKQKSQQQNQTTSKNSSKKEDWRNKVKKAMGLEKETTSETMAAQEKQIHADLASFEQSVKKSEGNSKKHSEENVMNNDVENNKSIHH